MFPLLAVGLLCGITTSSASTSVKIDIGDLNSKQEQSFPADINSLEYNKPRSDYWWDRPNSPFHQAHGSSHNVPVSQTVNFNNPFLTPDLFGPQGNQRSNSSTFTPGAPSVFKLNIKNNPFLNNLPSSTSPASTSGTGSQPANPDFAFSAHGKPVESPHGFLGVQNQNQNDRSDSGIPFTGHTIDPVITFAPCNHTIQPEPTTQKKIPLVLPEFYNPQKIQNPSGSPNYNPNENKNSPSGQNDLNNFISGGKSSIPGSVIKFLGGAGLSPGSIQILPEPEVSNSGETGQKPAGESTKKPARDIASVSSANNLFGNPIDYSGTNFDDVRFLSTIQGPAYLPPIGGPAPPTPEIPKLELPTRSPPVYTSQPPFVIKPAPIPQVIPVFVGPPTGNEAYIPPRPSTSIILTPSTPGYFTPAPTVKPFPSFRPQPNIPSVTPGPFTSAPTFKPFPSFRPQPNIPVAIGIQTEAPQVSTKGYLPPKSTPFASSNVNNQFQPFPSTKPPYNPPPIVNTQRPLPSPTYIPIQPTTNRDYLPPKSFVPPTSNGPYQPAPVSQFPSFPSFPSSFPSFPSTPRQNPFEYTPRIPSPSTSKPTYQPAPIQTPRPVTTSKYEPSPLEVKPTSPYPPPTYRPPSVRPQPTPGYNYPSPSPSNTDIITLYTTPKPRVTNGYSYSTPSPSFPPAPISFRPVTNGYSYPTPTPAFPIPSSPIGFPSTFRPSITNGYSYPAPSPSFPLPSSSISYPSTVRPITNGYSYPKPSPSFPSTPKPFIPDYDYQRPSPSPSIISTVEIQTTARPRPSYPTTPRPTIPTRGYSYPKPSSPNVFVTGANTFIQPSIRPAPQPTTNANTYLPPATSAPSIGGGYIYQKPTPTFGYPSTLVGASGNNNNQYIPPPTTPANNEKTGSDTSDTFSKVRPPGEPQPDGSSTNTNSLPPAACAAALKCVQEIYCNADGTISPVPVVLTKEQEVSRVPTTECRDVQSGIVGKCCRDPFYKDPWPSANLVNGFDDGQYREDDSIGQYKGLGTGQYNQQVNPGQYNQQVNPGQYNQQVIPGQYDQKIDQGQYNQEVFAGQNPIDLQRLSRSNLGGNRNTITDDASRDVEPLDSTCGTRNLNTTPRGSTPLNVNFAEIPWQAMILRDSNRSLLCGGAIIERNAVLTTAHCVAGLPTSDILVKGGEWKLGIDEEPLPFQIVKVAVIVVHPNYKQGSLVNDLAILILQEKLRPAKNVGKICLPKPNEIPTRNCIVTGWGKRILQLHAKGAIMRAVDVNIMDSEQCQQTIAKSYQNAVQNYSPNTLCGFSKNDQCKVDYGSALACSNNNNQYTLSGIFSWDTGCKDANQIGGYVAPDVEWIHSCLRRPIRDLKKLEKQYY